MSIPKRAAAALAATATALVLTACSSSGSVKSPTTGQSTSSASQQAPATSTSWDRNPSQSTTAKAAGLSMLTSEGQVQHYHAHLDVIVDGQPVVVPAYIGIDEQAQMISPLHTHDPSGIIHIESPDTSTYTLGQLFTEWGQPLSATQVGPVSLGSDKALHVFVNGKEISDPANYVLKAHDEIAVWVGAKSETPQVPSSYTFAPGL